MNFTKILFFTFAMCCATAFGQRHELGVRGGFSSFVGDVGRTGYIQNPILSNPSELGIPVYLGVMYRMNFNPHQTLRFDLGYNQLQFSDHHAKEIYRKNRGKYGSNAGVDADVLFEYYFFPVNNEQKGMLSPYIFGGLGGSIYSVRQVILEDTAPSGATTPNLQNATEKFGNRLFISTPFGIGLKYKFNYNWAISAEAMFRPMYSDGLDYSVVDKNDVKIQYTHGNNKTNGTTNKDYTAQAQQQVDKYLENRNFGNKNSNDWVNTISVGLTYSFGRPPCYCDQ